MRWTVAILCLACLLLCVSAAPPDKAGRENKKEKDQKEKSPSQGSSKGIVQATGKDDKKGDSPGNSRAVSPLGQKSPKLARKLGKLNDKQKERFLKSFGKTDIDVVNEKLGKLRNKLRKKLEQTPEQKKKMKERMKHHKNKERTPKLRKEGDTLMEVNKQLELENNFYQGDMILTVDQLNQIVEEDSDSAPSSPTASSSKPKRMAYKPSSYPNNMWMGETVYYYFDAALTDKHTRSVFEQAVAFWKDNTCINFAVSATAPNRIRVYQGEGCYSYIGRIGGQQDLSMGVGCDSFGTAVHELGHALGFFHTQARFDRDNFIYLNASNVEDGWLDQFHKQSTATNDNFGRAYDYGSVMQYGGNSVSGNGQATMVAYNQYYQDTMGSDDYAFYDLDIMNELYKCKARCPGTPVVCSNGGFPNPRACTTTCICPEGYGGPKCASGRPTGCGEEVTATATPKLLFGISGDNVTEIRDRFHKCHYRITAPAGKRIEMKITDYYGPYCGSGCVYGAIEIKALTDQRKTGYRFCCKEDINTLVISETNIVPIIVANRYYRSRVTIQYRYV